MNLTGKLISLLGASCLVAFASAAPASADDEALLLQRRPILQLDAYDLQPLRREGRAAGILRQKLQWLQRTL